MLGRLQHLFAKKQEVASDQPEEGKERRKTAPQPGQTQPLGPLEEESRSRQSPSFQLSKVFLEPAQFLAACGQSVGLQRDHNEDALFTLTTNLVSDTRQIPFGLYIVADGMGGHQNGEVASAQAVRSMAGQVLRKVYLPLFSNDNSSPDESLQEIMQQSAMEAHKTILKQALGGGTTLTAVLVLGKQMTIAHVGDSRAYAVHQDGRLELLTRDHSLVKRLEELGQITTEEAAAHPQRNVLYRALGQGELFEPDIITSPIPENGFLLLCSDGLWGVLEEDQMVEIIAAASSTNEACTALVQAANEAGGPDNISIILVYIPSG